MPHPHFHSPIKSPLSRCLSRSLDSFLLPRFLCRRLYKRHKWLRCPPMCGLRPTRSEIIIYFFPQISQNFPYSDTRRLLWSSYDSIKTSKLLNRMPRPPPYSSPVLTNRPLNPATELLPRNSSQPLLRPPAMFSSLTPVRLARRTFNSRMSHMVIVECMTWLLLPMAHMQVHGHRTWRSWPQTP